MKSIVLCVLVLLSSGCAMFQNFGVEQKTVFIKSAARTGIYLGLTQLVEDVQRRQDVALALKQDVVQNVLALLNKDGVQVSSANLDLLLTKIPLELRPFVCDALVILHSYLKEADVTDSMDENGVKLLKAFFQGVIEGCDLIIVNDIGELYNGLGNYCHACFAKHAERR